MSKKNVSHLKGVVFCCHGGSCTRAGARTVEKAMRLAAREHGLKNDVKFVRTACTGLCKSAPVVIACVNPQPEAEPEAPASTCGAQWLLEVQAQDAGPLFNAHFAPQDAAAHPEPQPPAEPKAPRKKPKKRKKK